MIYQPVLQLPIYLISWNCMLLLSSNVLPTYSSYSSYSPKKESKKINKKTQHHLVHAIFFFLCRSLVRSSLPLPNNTYSNPVSLFATHPPTHLPTHSFSLCSIIHLRITTLEHLPTLFRYIRVSLVSGIILILHTYLLDYPSWTIYVDMSLVLS